MDQSHTPSQISNATYVDAVPARTYDADPPWREYIDACRQRVWLIVLIALAFAVAAAIWSLMQTPVYQARATVLIDIQAPSALETGKVREWDHSPEYFQTQFELLKSRQVLRRAADLLQLSDRPEYQSRESWFDMILPSLWRSASEETEALDAASLDEPAKDEQINERVLKRFSENVDIMPIRGSRLAHVTVSDTDAAFAALAANTLVSVYIQRNQEFSTSSREQASQWFTAHLEGLRNKVRESQQALYLYRVKHGLLAGDQRKSVTGHTLTELNSQVVKSEMAKAEAQSRLEQIQSVLHGQGNQAENDGWSQLDSLSQVLNSHLIQTLRGQEITLSSQVADLSQRLGPLHPDRAQKNIELHNLRQHIKQEVQKIYDSLKHEYNMAVAQERAVKAALARYGTDKIRLEENEIEHNMLEREADSSQDVYNIFLKVSKESDLLAGTHTNNVYLADPAQPTSTPARPRTKRNIILSLASGLISGIGLAIILEGRNKKLKAPADVERYIPDVSLLGVVPRIPQISTVDKDLLGPDSSTPAVESFRIIRTGVLLSRPDTLPSRVLITSPGDNEGKTTLAVNLAMAMAKLEHHRAILVDVDFRKGLPHPIYNVANGDHSPMGLTHLLRGEANVGDVVYASRVPNLWIVPRGDRAGNATELLHAQSLNQLFEWAQAQQCHVILDCPPTLPFADTSVLAGKVDGVLLVVSAGETTREACRLAVQRLTFAGGKLLGIVMQKAALETSPYFYVMQESR